ncbi:MAG: 8-oxo-dGTP diphosphatase [Frankiales bacterium]|nr:8-oxo-dGTP diphosphatase [Frankiales bacterium]MDX6257010.1 8-oxo-dGTP diphosphatase [Frankiales bacterium]
MLDVARKMGFAVFGRLPRRLRVLAVRAGTPGFTVGALVLLQRAGDASSVLLVHQRHTRQWALPGGLLRRGEGAAQGLRREVLEELGLTLDTVQTAHAVGVLVDARSRRVDVLFTCWLAADAPTPTPAHVEVDSVQWCSMAGLPRITAITAEVLAEYTALGLLGGD